MPVRYWLVKSEPEVFSIADLEKSPGKKTYWDGVRNYQARNYLRDDMKTGDPVLFYHSGCEVTGIVGLCEVVKEGYPDFTALDPKSGHYDPKSTKENPIWYMVDIKLVKIFPHQITLADIRQNKLLWNMKLIQPGNRLSVVPVEGKEYEEIISMSLK